MARIQARFGLLVRFLHFENEVLVVVPVPIDHYEVLRYPSDFPPKGSVREVHGHHVIPVLVVQQVVIAVVQLQRPLEAFVLYV